MSKNTKPIIVIAGEPNSIFLEIFFKSLKKNKFKNHIILIASKKLIELQSKKLGYKIKTKLIDEKKLIKNQLTKDKINLINIDYTQKKPFEKISSKSKNYIEASFQLCLKLLRKKVTDKIINGPISKKYFLSKKYLGITEYLKSKTNSKNAVMLIYNKELSVCPLTTHLPINSVSKNINKKMIIDQISILNSFYKMKFNFNPKIAILGLNPHCESNLKYNEDEKIIKPAVNYLKSKKINISGPFAADTIFLKNNRKMFNIIVGMYHDQVLTPIKTIYEYDAINLTLGLPFLRVSPDHGPNEKMLGKNLSNPLSLTQAINFLDKN